MNAFHLRHLAAAVAVLLLAGCGSGGTPTGGVPSSVTPNVAHHAVPGKSWMLPEAKSAALVYAGGQNFSNDVCGGICIFTYPSGKSVGALDADAFGMCSDSDGNVYLAYYNTVTIYAHGATTPTRTLSVPDSLNGGECSVDSVTGNLAVAAGNSSSSGVAIFPNASGAGTFYPITIEPFGVTYDNNANLFVSGHYGDGEALYEMPAGSTKLISIMLPQSLPPVEDGQWDGKYLAYESEEARGPRLIYRVSVQGSAATLVSRKHIHGVRGYTRGMWIYNKTVVIAYGNRSLRTDQIGVWNYPGLKTFSKFPYRSPFSFYAITVSAAPKHH
jgi:hypothetical protein